MFDIAGIVEHFWTVDGPKLTGPHRAPMQADRDPVDNVEEEGAAGHKKRTFRKYSYRGVDLDQLLDLSSEQVGASDAPCLRVAHPYFPAH